MLCLNISVLVITQPLITKSNKRGEDDCVHLKIAHLVAFQLFIKDEKLQEKCLLKIHKNHESLVPQIFCTIRTYS